MKKKYLIPYTLTFCVIALLLTASNDEFYFKVNKSFEIFGAVFKEISANYVDDIDPQDLMDDGIEGMLKNLDPYTVFIDEKDGESIDIMTDGAYVGVGITVGTRDSMLTIVEVQDGYSASKQGVRIGDRIFKVDSVEVLHSESDELRKYTKGKIGSKLDMWLFREGTRDTIKVALKREEIKIKNVPYFGMVNDSIGYIKLERFTRNSKDEVVKAFQDLKKKNKLKGLVFDLRDNPGGLLESAVSITELFVPMGSKIVSIKGRNKRDERIYYSDTNPLDTSLPIALLINSMSASASEIVAGALQDLDRAIIIGERSFGKGLVQTVIDLPYNTSIKITTSRYYTPSGRCIQRFEFHNKYKSNIEHTDSVFHTKNGRHLVESNGIEPDTIVKETRISDFVGYLRKKDLFFKFANFYSAKKDLNSKNLIVDNKVLETFYSYLKNECGDIEFPFIKQIIDLDSTAKKEKVGKKVLKKIEEVKILMEKEEYNPVKSHSEEITKILDKELNRRIYTQNEFIKYGLKDDEDLKVAIPLINRNSYNKILALSETKNNVH
ncbi:MAG: S41 family peptidase [Bacteroidetes bacterium]|nr:MAG: S41 family peptidase [Bacteroidota bacterium]